MNACIAHGGRCALALGLSLLAPLHARAGDWYVDAVGGDDANSGSTPTDAWRTLTHALLQPVPHLDTVHVAPGLYDAALGESFPLPLRSYLVLVGDAGPDVTIVDGGGTAILIDARGADGSLLAGLWLRNAGLGIDYRLDFEQSSWLRVEDVLLSDMQGRGIDGYVIGFGLDVLTSLRLELTRTTVRACAGEGIFLRAEAFVGDYDWTEATAELVDSRIEGCGTGIHAESDGNVESSASALLDRSVLAFNGTGCEAEFLDAWRSTVYGNAARGLYGYGGLRVRNCIAWGNGVDILAGGWVDPTIDYTDYSGGSSGLHGNIAADPRFVDAAGGDFRLRFWSPCADAGLPGFWLPTIDGDLDAHERLDMGAFELAPLAVNGVARIGQSFDLELWGPAGGSALVYFAEGDPVDPPFPTPFGEFDLVRAHAVLFASAATAPGPPGILPVAVPDDPALVGRSFSFQALSTSSVRTPRQAWTNAVTVTIEP